ncbi:MAG: hypothetical protein ACFCVH_09890 [Alphaproteobacteria bacterium]
MNEIMQPSSVNDLLHAADGAATVARDSPTREALVHLVRPSFATMGTLGGGPLNDRTLSREACERRFWWRWGGPYAALLLGVPLVLWAAAIAGAAFRGTLDADWPSIIRACGLVHLAVWTAALFFLPIGLREYRKRVGSLPDPALALRATVDGLMVSRDAETALAGPWHSLTLLEVGVGRMWFTPIRLRQVEAIVLGDAQGRRETLSAHHLAGGHETLVCIVHRLIRHDRLLGLPKI